MQSEFSNMKDEIVSSFKSGDMLQKLIYINLGVFVVVGLIGVAQFLFRVESSWLTYLEFPASFTSFLCRPWTIVTFMFLHEGFIHLIINLLMLYWFGKIFMQLYHVQRDLTGLYLLGGVGGALFYMMAYNIFPQFSDKVEYSVLLGASASVMAIVVAVAVTSPNYLIKLLFFGDVKLKWVAFVSVLISLLNVASGNAGGEISHLGGAFAGFMFAYQYKKGVNITKWINNCVDWCVNIFSKRPRMKVASGSGTYAGRNGSDYDYNLRKRQQDENVNRILEKIKRGGYDSLTNEEKHELFKAGQRK